MRKVIKGAFLFICCSAISIAGWLFVFVLALSKSGFGVGVGKSSTTLESAAMLAAAVLPFILFPIVAWKFRKDLKGFSVVFGLGPILLIFVFLAYFQIRDARMRQKYLADNPPTGETRRNFEDGRVHLIINQKDGKRHGESIEYCEDGSVKLQGTFENGLGVGVHQYRSSCSDSIIDTTVFDPPGEIIESKRYIDGEVMSHSYRDATYIEGKKTVEIEYSWDKTNGKKFVSSKGYKIREKDIFPPFESYVQTFNENGTILSEFNHVQGKESVRKDFSEKGILKSEVVIIGGQGKTEKTYNEKGVLILQKEFDKNGALVSEEGY